jgi:hypothetical protein
LTEVPQNVGVKQYVRAAFVGYDEAEPFYRIKPLDGAADAF